MCGCEIPEKPRPAIQFANIVAKNSVQHGVEPLVLPPAADYLAPFKEWKKLGNDRYGDCVPVTWANMRRLVTSKLTGREVYPSMHQVMELYRTLSPNFVEDVGMTIQSLLDHLVKNGGPDGVRAIAFAQVKITENLEEIRKALAIFGSVWVGLNVNQQNRDEFNYRQSWTPAIQKNEPPDGHSVLVGGYLDNSNLKVVTWGETAQLTKAFAVSRMREAWVVIWPEHLGSRRFMNGVNLAQLRSEFEALTKSTLGPLKPSLNRVHYILPPEQQSPKRFLEIRTIVPDTAASLHATYSTPSVHAITPISKKNALRGTLLVDNDDLYLIRTTETADDFVEVTRVFGPAYYDLEYEKPIVTAFKSTGGDQGVFTIDNGDLYFIKTKGTSSGFIEVYFAPHEQLFQAIQRYVTGFEESVTADRFTVSGGDLYLITKGNEHDAFLQIRCARGNANYSEESITCQTTAVPFEKASEFFNIGLNGDLYMVKSADTASKQVEVWIAKAQDNYAEVLRYTTEVEAQQELNATQATLKTTWIV